MGRLAEAIESAATVVRVVYEQDVKYPAAALAYYAFVAFIPLLMAIAQAITEHVHDRVGATTLFATHHHPLTELADDLEAAFTLHFEVDEDDGEVVFHHEIAPGAATGSYGVEVATAAGVPETVVERSRELVAEAAGDDGEPIEEGEDAGDADAPVEPTEDEVAAATADGGDIPTDVAAELRALDLAHLTPVEALTELDRLKRLLEE